MNDKNMRKGIASAGNWLMDFVKIIEAYPRKGNIVTIESQEAGLGGCSHNVLVDLARMQTGLPLYAGGCIGDDENGRYILSQLKLHGINADGMVVVSDVPTSYTDVMTEKHGGARTFFHCRGANARLGVEHIAAMHNPAKIFHLGYLLLLDRLDCPDEEYGVAAARALNLLGKAGYKTSVDMVSEEGDRFRKVLMPCLKYIDYLIINEIEAGESTGIDIRLSDGSFDRKGLETAARILMEQGVREQISIHLPEGGYTLHRTGESAFVGSIPVPADEIAGTVGAGDAFCAGMLYALHEEYSPVDALRFANASARFCLKSPTSTGGAPDLRTLECYLRDTWSDYRN